MREDGVSEGYARVLVVNGYPFTRATATGITLLSLFKGWPPERLACFHVSQLAPEPGIAEWTWNVGTLNDPFARRVFPLFGKRLYGAGAATEAARPSHASGPRSVSGVRALVSEQHAAELSRFVVPTSVMREVREFQPDVIYTMLGSNRVMRLVLDLSDACSIGVVPHFMDDWPATAYGRSVLRPVLRFRMRALLAAVLARAPVRMAIGRDMADEFERRYGGAFASFMNAVEPAALERAEPPPVRRVVRLLYAGGLHLGRWRSLRDIGRALASLHREGLDAELVVHTQSRFAGEARRLESSGVVHVAGPLAPDSVPAALRTADILVHVESFNNSSQRYARYSMSTKIPECMAACRPILAYGPGDLASVRYVSDCGAGVAVGTRDEHALVGELRRLIASRQMREQLGRRGFDMAIAHHNAEAQRERFRLLLASAGSENLETSARSVSRCAVR